MARPMPPIPETGWTAPEFPNLAAARVISFDTETYDPQLKTHGPGWARGVGHMIGASLAVEDGTSWYFPMKHETCPEQNLDSENVKAFLRHTLGDNRPKVGANLIYDLGWCLEEGIHVGGRLYDVQFAEALLNSEAPDVSLEGLAQSYLGVGKETSILYDWLSQWQGGPPTEKQRQHLYLSPPSLAGPYAESDASLPLEIIKRQWPVLHERGLTELFDLECRLIPLLVAMRRRGVRIDIARAEELYDSLGTRLDNAEISLRDIAGRPVNPNAPESIKNAFVALGIEVPTTISKTTGMETVSFAKPLLEAVDHPLAKAILDYRALAKVRNVFIKSYLLDKNVNGKLFCSFHPLKSTEGGTRSGRYASSLPNLQNIPIRTEIGRLVRACFIASQGGRWRKWDASQIEYRLLAHFAVGPGSDKLRQTYIDNPDTDYHNEIIRLIKLMTAVELDRRPAKNINFGLIYGMSQPKLVLDLGLTPAKGKELFNAYHKAAPFVRSTMDAASRMVHQHGYITTVLGRRSEFKIWGPKGQNPDRKWAPTWEAAYARWGYEIERQHTHKAINRRLQGSAADVMKKGMVDAYEAGLFADDACGIPGLTVHDELDFDDTGDPNAECWNELKRVLENALPLRVPVRYDMSIGPNWGACA